MPHAIGHEGVLQIDHYERGTRGVEIGKAMLVAAPCYDPLDDLVGNSGAIQLHRTPPCWYVEPIACVTGRSVTPYETRSRRKAPCMILIFGSINVDVIVPVQRLPYPGETVLGGDLAVLPGGKGANQAMAARRAGAEVAMAGAVGGDSFAAVALEPLRRAGIDIRLVQTVERPTGCAAIMVSATGENMIAVAPGANLCAQSDQVPEERLGPGTILVGQMEVPPAETATMIRRARASGGRCVLNLAPAAPIARELLRDIDVLVANEGEAASLGSDPAQVAAQLRQGFVVTRGAAGAVAHLGDGSTLSVPASQIVPVDTTGAGDTFVGVLAATLDRGAPLAAALKRACVAAGLACLARGAQAAMPDAAAIDMAMAQLPQD
jgi:ribokinase